MISRGDDNKKSNNLIRVGDKINKWNSQN
jgi:hypothetical protein